MVFTLHFSLGQEEGVIRLVGGQEYFEGRVEVFHDGAWGTVCDDGWDIDDAHVVCRQLSFPGATQALDGATFGSGNKAQFDCDHLKVKAVRYNNTCAIH